MKGLTLTQKEQARLQVLNGILEGQISVDEAAEVLGVSERHVWRILAEYRKEGAAVLAHGNRGRRANNSIPEEARTQVVALARTRYARVNHTHLTELLAEREEIVLGRSTVRRILVGAGMASPRRRRPPLHRVRRQRMSQEGMLVQVDGSVHAWLEERGPRCTLLLAIDDATSTVPYALFRHEEDTHGYFLLMQELIRRCGVPLALYSDRHAVFKYVPGSHQSPAPTQFGRAMAELGVEQIFARSPEANITEQLPLHRRHKTRAGGVATPKDTRHSTHGPGSQKGGEEQQTARKTTAGQRARPVHQMPARTRQAKQGPL